ncbi:unnamed protein product [Cyprideis torosa]|uniref:Lipoyl synthase, mitochondrial n=1 Tax=Cyprideis torosa TaxID=163714 RepID=A0A7R8ZVY2_9CRUS|nr:unnamed protein product [Cyprideis torosa]CAG0908208.1 unnamed protein product [Cyprideis torosa]
MHVQYAVVTSVTRDDLLDGGASFFAETIERIRELSPQTLVEVLIPDLQGNWEALAFILAARPAVLNHNMETVPRLYPTVRPQAGYELSLSLLAECKRRDPAMVTKSGIMVGLGEGRREIETVMDDLLEVGCDILTIGQYLQPSKNHLPVVDFVAPEVFVELEGVARKKGFPGVASSPMVRSSYEAGEIYRQVTESRGQA